MSNLKNKAEAMEKLVKKLNEALAAADDTVEDPDYQAMLKIMNKYSIQSYRMNCELRDVERSKKIEVAK